MTRMISLLVVIGVFAAACAPAVYAFATLA